MHPRWTRARLSPGENRSESHSLRRSPDRALATAARVACLACSHQRGTLRAASNSYLGTVDLEGRARNPEPRMGTPIPPDRPQPGRAANGYKRGVSKSPATLVLIRLRL